MKLTLAWLNECLEVDNSLENRDVLSIATNIGLEVETEVRERSFAGVIVAKIIATEKHPNADKLQVCKVFNGVEDLQIVCGAPNARAGIVVALAQVGTVIPNGNFIIKKSVIRGVESNGMLCSANELLLNSSSAEIIELPDNFEIGEAFDKVYKQTFERDLPIEIKLTPNRGDAASIVGIARDLAACNIGVFKSINYSQPVCIDSEAPCDISIGIENCELNFCKITDLATNVSSPRWIQERLEVVGIKPKNAVVDILNYVMFHLGQPLHAYDADKIGTKFHIGRRINKEFIDLKGEKHLLDDDIITVQNDGCDVAIAGIIGSDDSKINNITCNIIVESAIFDPTIVARMGQKLKITSDARFRFERGIDIENSLNALYYAVNMIIEVCGGQIQWITSKAIPKMAKTIIFDTQNIYRLLGYKLTKLQVTSILTQLGFKAMADVKSDNILEVVVPSWRHDIFNEQDLIEEVARIYGYDKIPITPLPMQCISMDTKLHNNIDAKKILAINGMQEIVSMPFVDIAEAELFGITNKALTLCNAIAIEKNYMRNSILIGLVNAIKINMGIDREYLSFFEEGLVFSGCQDKQQHKVLAGVYCGSSIVVYDALKCREVDIFDAKRAILQIVESVFKINIKQLVYNKLELVYTHPTRSFAVQYNNQNIGHFGEIHPNIQKKFNINKKVSFFELFLDKLPQPLLTRNFNEFIPNEIQAIIREFAFIVDLDCTVSMFLNSIYAVKEDVIKHVKLVDIYSGSGLPNGKKSFSVLITLKAQHNMTTAEIDNISNKIINSVSVTVQGVLRDRVIEI